MTKSIDETLDSEDSTFNAQEFYEDSRNLHLSIEKGKQQIAKNNTRIQRVKRLVPLAYITAASALQIGAMELADSLMHNGNENLSYVIASATGTLLVTGYVLARSLKKIFINTREFENEQLNAVISDGEKKIVAAYDQLSRRQPNTDVNQTP